MGLLVVQNALVVRAHDISGVVKLHGDPLWGPSVRPAVDQGDHPNLMVGHSEVATVLEIGSLKNINDILLEIDPICKKNQKNVWIISCSSQSG